MSHRRFMGWEPAEVTTFEYDGDRLVRSVTVREPEFNSRERSLILAHLAHKADEGPYGIPLSHATDPERRFEASKLPVENFAVKAATIAQKAYFERYKDADPHNPSLMWRVTEIRD